MDGNPVKKINYVYLLCYILVPLAAAAAGLLIGYTFFRDGGTGAVICMFALPLLAVLWWIFAGRNIYRLGKKRMIKQLDDMGIDRRQIFYSDGCVVSMDMAQGKIGLLFFWNPFQVQVAPAGRVTRAWTDDGAGGVGFTRGTSRVSFLFEIDGIKIRVNTFISNQRWKMNDAKVLEGISKADLWVQTLGQAAGQTAGGGNGTD